MASSLRKPKFLFMLPLLLLLLTAVACGSDTPAAQPVPTPIDVAAIVQQAVSAQPSGATPQDVADAISKALAAQPGGVTSADMASAIAKALAAQPGVSQEDVAMAVETVLKAQPELSAADIEKAVESAVEAAVAQALPAAVTGPRGTIDVGRAELGAYICDPKNTAGVADVGMQGHETLFAVNTKDEIVPKLVRSWELSDDNLTWTFELNRGVMFSKGYGELTADDVVFTMMRGTEDGSSMPRAGALREKWRNADGLVEIVGDYTIRVNTGTPVVDMLPELSTPFAGYIVSKKQVDEVGWAAASDNCATTGPWDIVEHRTSDFFTWEAVENHWRKTPEFANLTLREIPEESTRLAGFQTNKLDTFVMAFDTLPSVENLPGVKLMEKLSRGHNAFRPLRQLLRHGASRLRPFDALDIALC